MLDTMWSKQKAHTWHSDQLVAPRANGILRISNSNLIIGVLGGCAVSALTKILLEFEFLPFRLPFQLLDSACFNSLESGFGLIFIHRRVDELHMTGTFSDPLLPRRSRGSCCGITRGSG